MFLLKQLSKSVQNWPKVPLRLKCLHLTAFQHLSDHCFGDCVSGRYIGDEEDKGQKNTMLP